MSAYLITGPSGSGKSRVGAEIKARGYRVVETDFEPGLSGWYDIATNTLARELPQQPYAKVWLDSHAWRWDRKVIQGVLADTGDRPIFFVGGAHNEAAQYDLFAVRFGLIVDDGTLTQRLQAREPLRWKTGSAELTLMLEWNTKYLEVCAKNGLTAIDSSRSPATVAEDIITRSNVTAQWCQV